MRLTKVIGMFALAASLGLVHTALAQQPVSRTTRNPDPVGSHISLGQMTPTPEMWFYDQAQRQHSDPQSAVREKAEFESIQRQRRIAARQWFGVSNARPNAEVTPMMGTYSPTWVSNTRNPAQWSGQGPVYSANRGRPMVW